MRLNKIEIKGFKSFGDKTIINFNSGVTGIVDQMDVVNQILLMQLDGF